jgi:Fic family protein
MHIEKIKELKNSKDSNYFDFIYKFNYHSNKIDGSKVSLEDVFNLMEYQEVQSEYKQEDILQTKNSFELFNFIVNTLGQSITKLSLLEFHSILKKNAITDKKIFKGSFKKTPNKVSGVVVKIAGNNEVESKLDELIKWWDGLEKKALINIAEFHLRFENIQPFKDGSGRIGRLIILKQCIEANINPILINSNNTLEYKRVLTKCNVKDLYEFFCDCEQYEF